MSATVDYLPPPCEHRPDLPVACSRCAERMQKAAVRIKVGGPYIDRTKLEREQTAVMVAYAERQGWAPVGPADHAWLNMSDPRDRFQVREWLDNPDDPSEIPRFRYVLESQQWCRTDAEHSVTE
jgi:hypothetical protein